MKVLKFAFAVLCLAAARAAAQVGTETVYGNDDRREVFQVDKKWRKTAESTVALFRASSIDPFSERAGMVLLKTSPYGESMNLCKEEPFWDQRNGAFCSGSLVVAPDLIMTAGHCVRSQGDCENVRFVFGFDYRDGSGTQDKLPAGEVYSCKTLLGREQVNDGADWALVRLDRPVINHKPLTLSGADAPKGTPLVVIGHPAGLPTKIAGGARVRDDSKTGYLVANLDTYGGNSGSAVFNAKTRLVEGILVRGDADYEPKDPARPGSCRISHRCASAGCRGEDVTRITSVMPHLPTPTTASRVAPVDERVSALIEKLASAETDFDR